jgi:hypothetical protein
MAPPRAENDATDPAALLRRHKMKDLDKADAANRISINEQIGFRFIVEELVKAGKLVYFSAISIFLFLIFCQISKEVFWYLILRLCY